MLDPRYGASASMFQGDDSVWWVTGGRVDSIYWNSTEIFNAMDNQFVYGIDLPKNMYYHNLINVNSTHMVVLGGKVDSEEVFIFDRYYVSVLLNIT